MYWSKYNRIYKVDNNRFAIYNYAWNKSIFITNILMNILQERINNIDDLSEVHPTFFKALIDNSMIVTNHSEELKSVKEHILSTLSSCKTLRLTINPTLDCNLRCWYCYESHNNKAYMSDQTIKSIGDFLVTRLNKEVENVILAFFGGEPLLTANKRALPIAQMISDICKKKEIPLSLHFTTNGSLLKPVIIDKIVQLGIPTTFQIAFDGDRSLHNKTKNWAGVGTYDIVLRNIDYALSKQLRVNVRCNYTAENITSFHHLIDDISVLENIDKSLIRISLQRVWQEPATKELFEQAKYLNEYANSLGYSTDLGGSVCAKSYCYADFDNSYVINYNGDVFKCTARDFDSAHKLGELDSNGNLLNVDTTYHSCMRIKPYCNGCSLLPICTICSQTHRENFSNECPKIISEDDKEGQIKRRFNEMFAEHI